MASGGFSLSSVPIPSPLSLQRTLLLLVVTGICSNEVLVQERLQAVLGKNATLSCRVQVGTNLSLTQSSWERQTARGSITLAVFNPQFGSSIAEEYKGRVRFLNPSVVDATIVLMGVGFADIGTYTCKVVTFPLGNTEASTIVDIMVEPKVNVLGSDSLQDGNVEGVVATCVAERARPPAQVFWEAHVDGRSEQATQEQSDGTTTTQVQYIWAPQRYAFKHNLTCVVRHPALTADVRIPHELDIQFAPEVLVVGRGENWYVGQENAKLECIATANPPPYHFFWSRRQMQMPAGVVLANGTLSFTRALQRNDSGTYRCEVQNKLGLRFQDVNIWIREPPTTVPAPVTTIAVMTETTALARVRAGPFTPTSTLQPNSNVGSVVGGTVGGILILALLLAIGTLCYFRQRRTFRGDYYTKQYIGPSDMQKSHELHDAFEDDSAASSQDLKPKAEVDGGDAIYHDYTKNEGDWSSYYPEKKINTSAPLNNGGPFIQDNGYEVNTDYVAHVDGSVISRREWYV